MRAAARELRVRVPEDFEPGQAPGEDDQVSKLESSSLLTLQNKFGYVTDEILAVQVAALISPP